MPVELNTYTKLWVSYFTCNYNVVVLNYALAKSPGKDKSSVTFPNEKENLKYLGCGNVKKLGR